MESTKAMELREQLQEDILTILDDTHYEYLIQSVKDKLKDQLCEVVCDCFFNKYGV